MYKVCSIRDIVRNPAILKIDGSDIIEIEDKRAKKIVGFYIGKALGEEFIRFLEKKRMLESAKRIKECSLKEYKELEGSIEGGLKLLLSLV